MPESLAIISRTRHRVRPQDFTRQRQLTFPLLMLFVLQQTVKSIPRWRGHRLMGVDSSLVRRS
jgi:hypothetical protein